MIRHWFFIGCTAIVVAASSSRTSESAEWTPLGPTSASVFALARSPFNPQEMMVGTYFGGIYRTVDRGARWTHVPSPFSMAPVFALAYDERNPGTIYAGTFEQGIYKTTDDGQTWTEINNGLVSLSISDLAIDPFDSETILVTTESGLYHSTNGGAAWVVADGTSGLSARSLAFDPSQLGRVYMGTLRGGAYRSLDGGQTWETFNDGIGMRDVNALNFDGNGSLHASTDNGVFRLSEVAQTWENISYDLPEAPVNQTFEHPIDGRLFAATDAGTYTLDVAQGAQSWLIWNETPTRLISVEPSGDFIYLAGTYAVLMATNDDGQSFFPIAQGIQNLFGGSLAAANVNGTSVIYSGSDQGIHFTSESFRTGENLPWIQSNGFNQGVFGIAIHPNDPGVLYAGTERSGVWRSSDWGSNWNQVSEGIVPPQIYSLSQSPVGDNTLYAGTSTGLYISRDDGETWTTATNSAISTQILSVLADPVLPEVAYFAGSDGAVYKTIDDGFTFQWIGVGLPGDNVTRLASAPFGNLYAVTTSGRLYISFDNGGEWFAGAAEVSETILSVATDPELPWIAYIGTSEGGVYRSSSNGISWEPINDGLTVPYVFHLSVDPSDGNVIYAGTVGTIFKSTDGGETWREVGNGLPEGFVEFMDVHPDNPDLLLASVKNAGIYKSTDAGAAWVESAGGPPFVGDIPIMMSRLTPNKVFVGSHIEGVFSSLDGGETYERSSTGMSLFVRSVKINPDNPEILFAGSLGGGMFRTIDGAVNWTNVGLGDRNIFAIVLDPLNSSTVYAATSRGVVRSTDGGDNWFDLGQKTAFVLSMLVDPTDRDVVYIGSIAGRMFKSADGGATWAEIGAGLPPANIIAVTVDPRDGTLYVSAEREGVYLSSDGGETWQPTNPNPLGGFQVVSLTVDTNTGSVFAAANDEGFYRSTDGGDTWIASSDGFAGDVAAQVVVDPFDGTLYGIALNETGNFNGVSRSTDGGATWSAASNGITTESVLFLAADPESPGLLYVATDAGVFKSTNGATTWQASSIGLENVRVGTLLIDLHNTNVLYAGTGGDGVYKSIDGGLTWLATDLGVPGVDALTLGCGRNAGTILAGSLQTGLFRTTDAGATWVGGVGQDFAEPIVTFLAINPSNPQVLYAAAAGQGLLRTRDGGVTWKKIGQEIPTPFILAIVIDPNNPDTLYVGTTGEGVWMSEDGGDTFSPLNDGLFNKNVTSLLIDPVNPHIIYVGTEGGGVFRLDQTPAPPDSDGDGVPDAEDCAPLDPRLASLHTFYEDLDEDHYGNPLMPHEVCAAIPEPPLVSWANDPWDIDPNIFPATVPKQDRRLAMDLTSFAQDGEFPSEAVMDLGLDATSFEVMWSEVETTPGSFLGPQVAALQTANTLYSQHGLDVSLTVSPISSRFLTVPADLVSGLSTGAVRFNDPTVIDRFLRLLTFIHGELPDVELVSIQFGHEIDLFVNGFLIEGFWQDYLELLGAASAHAKGLWGPELSVGVTWTADGFLNPGLDPMRLLLDQAVDHISVTYHPRRPDFTVLEPALVSGQLQQLVNAANTKSLHFQTVGYPTAPATGSSATKQSQFFKAFFDFWDQWHAQIPYVSFGLLHDPSRSGAESLVGIRFSNIAPDLRPRAVAYVGTFGLRTFEGGGEAKTGYKTLRNLAFDRGWWRDSGRDSRRFYLGFTPSPYDLPPDPETQWEVSQWVTNRIQHDADLFAIHMDGGIPWIEAYNDDFSLPELPYSDSVKGTFLNYRNNIPPGHRLLVSINPLGIPRDLLAPYWGYGQGFDYDQDFNRIPNGQFADDQNRMPPSPFDQLDFDSPSVQIAFLNYARRVLQYFQPDYLLIGIEVSATLIEDPAQYQKYLELHRFVYENLKADPAYSDVPILVSFSATSYMVDEYGIAYKYDEQEPGVRERVVEEFERFLPYTDIVGLSLYPHYGKYNAYLTPGIIYDELFELLDRFGATGKPIGIAESGYAADPYSLFGIPFTGNPEKQNRFYRLLFRELDRQPNPVEFVVGFQIRDGDIGWQRQWEGSQQDPPTVNPTFVEFYKYFRDIGIYDGDGNLRPSGETWLRELALPRVSEVPDQNRITAVSTSDNLTAHFDLELTQRVSFHIDRPGAPALLNGGLGITVDGIDLGSNVIDIIASDPVLKQESYATLGAHSLADVQYRELFLALYREGPGDPMLQVEIRLYEDAMAYRYWIPGTGAREVTGETSTWNLPSGARLWYQTDTDNYEGLFRSGIVGEIAGELGAPMTAELPNGEHLVLTEADLSRYSGMTFHASDSGARAIEVEFLDDYTWTVDGDSPTPWRVAIFGPDLDGLVNSDAVTSLNEPAESTLFPDGVETSWIRPGRALWSVWYDNSSGFDLNVQKWYVERAAELGFEYVVVDAGWEIGFPAFGFADQFEALSDLVDHGHRDGRNVDIIVWKPSSEIQDDFFRNFFFQKLSEAGAAGVNIDFLLGESQQVNGFMERALRDAAGHQLVVIFGNVSKPTGLERTYPNAMSFEAVRGLEWNKIEEDLTPEHNAALPFTRLVAGPTTYRPVTFDPAELGDTTLVHQLASAGIFHSPLQTWAANPLYLLNQPDALDVIQAMSGIWDETIVLPESRIGSLVAMARRKGDRWFVFVLNGDSMDGRSINNVDLSFLGNGRYRGVFLANAVPDVFTRVDIPELDGTFDLDIAMLPGGGFVGMFTPLTP